MRVLDFIDDFLNLSMGILNKWQLTIWLVIPTLVVTFLLMQLEQRRLVKRFRQHYTYRVEIVQIAGKKFVTMSPVPLEKKNGK